MTTVGMLVFEGFDLLDVGAPYEVLLTASRLVERDATPGPFEVAVVGLSPAPVTAYGGMVVTPTATRLAAATRPARIVRVVRMVPLRLLQWAGAPAGRIRPGPSVLTPTSCRSAG